MCITSKIPICIHPTPPPKKKNYNNSICYTLNDSNHANSIFVLNNTTNFIPRLNIACIMSHCVTKGHNVNIANIWL